MMPSESELRTKGINMSFKLDNATVQKNIEALQAFMKKEGLEYFYVSSFDPYLNEYVPMKNSPRYYVTGFSGSVAEVLLPASGKVKLYVDGRYHEQADLECDSDIIDIVKTPQNTSNSSLLQEDLKSLGVKEIGIESQRTSLGFYQVLNKDYKVRSFSEDKMREVLPFESLGDFPAIKQLDSSLAGRSVSEKLDLIFKEEPNSAHFISAVDTLSWITNCRGYHLPFQSSFLGRGLAVKDKVYVFIEEGIELECGDNATEFITTDMTQTLKSLSSNIEKLYFDKTMLNASDFMTLESLFSKDVLENKDGGLIEFQSIKDETELNSIRASFKRSDKAIYNTIQTIKKRVGAGDKVSELDLYNLTTEKYNEQGAVGQSFNTIAGADANGSIIHYGDPKADVYLREDSMALLDSGGYFESGFATDTTRTFMCSNKEGSKKHKEIYTLVLKGTLNLQNAIFKPGTRGHGLDAICRQPLYQYGYDYAHGTGHGVGIHVHEGGAGISPARPYLMKPGQVVSIEPGIYIPGFGGVRLENIAIVKEHPEYAGFLCFENLVYIGFDPLLIDETLLTETEKKWLAEYEDICRERGTSFIN